MILVLSEASLEWTTEAVIDWIERLGGRWTRLNGEDAAGGAPLALELGAEGTTLALELEGRPLDAREVGCVWLRRWHDRRRLDLSGRLGEAGAEHALSRHLERELSAASEALHARFGHARWLTHPREARLNKVRVLEEAARAGLEIPPTLVTTSREALRRFRDAHGRVVAKSVGDAASLRYAGKAWAMFTEEVTDEALEALPERFFPSLVQARVEKAWEVRAFYLDGEIWAMAIFSQSNPRTETDFRRYDDARPNRCVPYRLPPAVADALRALMRALDTTTGSADLVRTPDGRHVFLEINPGGQFGMVSLPCNYPLERRVAEYLVRNDAPR